MTVESAKQEPLKISVVIPTYNMAHVISDTLKSVLHQTYTNFEIIVQDNDSRDATREVVRALADPRIKYFKNVSNLGYAKNLLEGRKNCTGDVLYFLGADDILSKNALEETARVFLSHGEVGAVTRPYFWFQESLDIPIRVTPGANLHKDAVISLGEFEKALYPLHNEILGQLSGLAFRMKYLEERFFTVENDWIAHGYPFLHIFKNHPVVFLKNCPVAIRIGSNLIRQKNSPAYNTSPTKRWIEMLDEILSEKKYRSFKDFFIRRVIAVNFVGLVQIRAYSSVQHVFREIRYLVVYKWTNVFDLKFWFFSLGCLLVPRGVLISAVDYYKNRLNSKFLKKIDFEYDIS